MNAKRLLTLTIFVIMICLQACTPAATQAPAPIAVEPRNPQQNAAPAAGQPRPQATSAPSLEEFYAPPPPDNQFEDPGINPQTDTRYDHLSTFALDVDTASYSVMRRYINDGNLPPYDSVRVEEYVNAFDPGYAAPRDAAFTIYADGAPAPTGFEDYFDYEPGASDYILRFGVQGYRVSEAERKPANLTFVIDVSGSMDMENRLELVKRSLRLLVDRLDGRDSVAIIVYGTDARPVLRPTSADRKSTILRAIERLSAEGSTNAEAGLQLGYRYASQAYREGAINRLILCSDGVANTGNTDPETILREVEDYVSQGITMTSIGVGMGNFNDVMMEKLADRGDGSYYYVDTLDEARSVFVDNLTSTLQVIAKDARVQVDFNNEIVESYRLIGYENRAIADEDFRNDSVDAGELGAGHSAVALYAVRLRAGAEGRLATVQLRWQDPDSGAVQEINGNFNTWELASRFEDSSPRYQLAVTVAQYAEILRESSYSGNTSLNELAHRAGWLADRLGEDEQVAEFADLVRRTAQLYY
jgi:Ca-activated chloride channel family protein